MSSSALLPPLLSFAHKNVALYFGSFDPVYKGHMEAVNFATLELECEYEPVAQIQIIISANMPRPSKPMRSLLHHRTEMLRLAFEEYPHVSVTDEDADALTERARIHCKANGGLLFGIMGSDQEEALAQQSKKPHIQVDRWIIIPRQVSTGVFTIKDDPLLPSTLVVVPATISEVKGSSPDGSYEFSSTRVRSHLLLENAAGARQLAPTKVVDYALLHQLYSTEFTWRRHAMFTLGLPIETPWYCLKAGVWLVDESRETNQGEEKVVPASDWTMPPSIESAGKGAVVIKVWSALLTTPESTPKTISASSSAGGVDGFQRELTVHQLIPQDVHGLSFVQPKCSYRHPDGLFALTATEYAGASVLQILRRHQATTKLACLLGTALGYTLKRLHGYHSDMKSDAKTGSLPPSYNSFKKWIMNSNTNVDMKDFRFQLGYTHGDANLGNFLVPPTTEELIMTNKDKNIDAASIELVIADPGDIVATKDQGLPCYEWYQCKSSVRRQLTAHPGSTHLADEFMRGFDFAYPVSLFNKSENVLIGRYWVEKSMRPL